MCGSNYNLENWSPVYIFLFLSSSICYDSLASVVLHICTLTTNLRMMLTGCFGEWPNLVLCKDQFESKPPKSKRNQIDQKVTNYDTKELVKLSLMLLLIKFSRDLTIFLMNCWLGGLILYVPFNSYGHVRRSVHLTTFVLGKLD